MRSSSNGTVSPCLTVPPFQELRQGGHDLLFYQPYQVMLNACGGVSGPIGPNSGHHSHGNSGPNTSVKTGTSSSCAASAEGALPCGGWPCQCICAGGTAFSYACIYMSRYYVQCRS